MITYRGLVDGHTVLVDNDGATGSLTHHVRHSPTGFGWGYGGSGASELARCLLLDALGDDAACPTCAGTGKLVFDPDTGTDSPYDEDHPPADSDQISRCGDCGGDGIIAGLPYQQYKWHVIGRLPQNQEWWISRDSVLAWLKGESWGPRRAVEPETAAEVAGGGGG